ncbi:hypothetical protein GHK86_09670 [Acidimicrobiaceae bacterium USS-CC1]|uniref:Fibronectin type-III domain-containing protein n=1 Tax=Acidiferrimicrobium australe TaxID=2664430 RepID=A0ABW9QT25_9ACTN|nr:hypothetical protein [Acidiferrimicrobium australe]
MGPAAGPAAAQGTGGVPLVTEAFTGPLQSSPWLTPATSSVTNGACLTAGGTTGSSPIPTCASPNAAEPGLQLTDNAQSQEGGVVYGTSVPTVDGLDASFDTYQFDPGVNGPADGIGFFLAAVDPSDPTPPTIGPDGGALAYAVNGGAAGLSHGYLGVGLDVYGNYDNSAYDGTGCGTDDSVDQTTAPQQVDVRGPGNGNAGYCVLDSTKDPLGSSGSLGGAALDTASTPTAVPVEVAVNPSNGAVTTASGITVPADSWVVAVHPIGGSPSSGGVGGCPSGDACLSGSLPSAVGDAPSSWLGANGVPRQLSFGWVGATGNSTEYHVVSHVQVSTLTGAPPTYTGATLTSAADHSALADGQDVTYTASVNVGGTPESDPVTITDPLPAGLVPAAGAQPQASGGGTFNASCTTTTTPAREQCTFSPPSGGGSLPVGTALTATFPAQVSTSGTSVAAGSAFDNTVTVSSPDGFAGTATDDTVSYGSATVTAASLTTAKPTVAGVEAVPPSALPPATLADATSGGTGSQASAPLASIPLASIPLASIPLASIPLASIPLASIALSNPSSSDPGLVAARQALASTPLSDLSIDYPPGCSGSACTGWPGVLAGTGFETAETPYQGVPLQSITLGQALADPTAGPRIDTVDLAQLGVQASPLASIPLASIELGSAPLASIGLGGATSPGAAITAWCTALANAGSSCAAFGIDPSGSSTSVTLMDLALAGVPLASIPLASIPLASIPLASIPLASIPLASIDLASSPLASIPLASIDLASSPLASIPLASIPLASTPLASIPLASISALSSVVDCATAASLCSSGTATLGQAAADGVLVGSATLADLGTYGTTTLGDLLAGLSSDPYASSTLGALLATVSQAELGRLTLGDLIEITVPPTSYQWQSVDLAGLPLAKDEVSGGHVDYTAGFSLSGTGPVTATVSLPEGFAYVPGSSELDGAAVADPTGTSTLTWKLPRADSGPNTLTFRANAGIGLGPAGASLTVSSPQGSSKPASASVDVVDGEEPAISSPATAATLSPGTVTNTATSPGNLEIGYLTAPGDLNDWTVTVPQGAELGLALSNLPATYDLELFGPGSQQLQGTPQQTLPPVTDTVPSLDSTATSEPTPGSQDIPVTPPPGDQLIAVSNNAHRQSQHIQTPPLAAGTYVVQVSGYNGASSTQPYLLQANVIGGGQPPSCPGGFTYASHLPTTLTATGGAPTVPSGTNTLFLVDPQRLAAAYGSSAAATVMADVNQVATDSAAGVHGAVVPVDAYSSVQGAYQQWDTNPCSVPYANDVVSAISSVVDGIVSATPSIKDVVIVGADDQVPFARIADGTSTSNERDYGSATFAGENNVEADALSEGYFFSDDPYVSATPLGVGSATLYTPQLGIGRLVEDPAQIEGALTRFVSSGGVLDAHTSLTTGYSFLTSGAQAVAADLSANGLAASTLIGGSWTSSDLSQALAGTAPADGTETVAANASGPPVIDSINAHFDFSRALPGVDDTTGSQANLFTTSDVSSPSPATSYLGRLLFSMGCHAGLSIDNTEVDTSLGAGVRTADWAKTFADEGALWVANTGYGYADTSRVAYSAKLMAGFAANLAGTLTIGEALAEAKQQYAAGQAILSPYDLKALMESTLYGLPMYGLNKVPAGPAPQAPGTTSATVAGLPAVPVSVDLSGSPAPHLQEVTAAGGAYYQVAGGGPGTQQTEFRPIEPLVTVPVDGPSGGVAHGALLTGLTSQDIAGFSPLYVQPATGSTDATPPVVGDAAFPGTLQRVAGLTTFTSAGPQQTTQLDLVAGQFIPDPASPGRGTQRLFDHLQADVLYVPSTSPLAGDYTPPTIDSSTATTTSNGAQFRVQVTPSSAGDPVTQVVVLYTSGTSPGTWTELPLVPDAGGTTWTGTESTVAGSDVQFLTQAVDAAGNVAVSDNEGADFSGTAPSPVAIALAGSQVAGTYTGTVTASITAPTGATCTLDGSPCSPTDGQLQVTATGYHTLTVTDPAGDSATRSFDISDAVTTTTLAAGANPALVGQQVQLTATVAADVAASGTPTGAVTFEDGGNTIAGCSDVALGASGTAACADAAPDVPSAPTLTAVYAPGGANPLAASTGSLVLTVQKAAVSVGLAASPSPGATGRSVTYTATVAPVGATPPGESTPTGTVVFTAGSAPVACSGTADGQLGGTSTATCTVTYDTAGPRSVTAHYQGDGFFAAASSTSVTESVLQSTALALTGSANPAQEGKAVTYTATVTPIPQGGATPTGTVTFADATTGTTLCTDVALSSAGAATCATTFAATGVREVTATYHPTGAFVGSTWTYSQVVSAHPCASFSGCNLRGIDLAGADLAGVNLGDSNLMGADLAGATLTGANLSGSNLQGADLSNAHAAGLSAEGVNFNYANLSSGDFSSGDFADSNMHDANLSDANFTDANLSGVNLHGADLTGTTPSPLTP